MNKVIIDTDILIDFLRGNDGAKKFLMELSREYVCYCSVITIAELYSGMREDEKSATEELLDGFYHLPINRPIAELAGQLKQQSKSRTLALDDCLIAATALVEAGVIATRNSKHYPFSTLSLKVPNYKT